MRSRLHLGIKRLQVLNYAALSSVRPDTVSARLQFAVTLGGIGLLAFGAVKYFNIDLDEILSAAKGRSR